MKNRIFFPTIISFFVINSILFGGIRENAESIIYQEFGDQVELNFYKFPLPNDLKKTVENEARQRFYSQFVYTWTLSDTSGIIGFVLLDNVKGKSMPITFLAMYNREGEVVRTAVVKYREPIGGEVANPRWLKQFVGQSALSRYDNIDGISGATISANSMKKGIKKLTVLLHHIQKELESYGPHETE